MIKSNQISKRSAVTILLGSVFLIWGMIWIYFPAYVISWELERANAYPGYMIYADSHRSILSQLWGHHSNLLIGMLSLISGIGLLARKKIGWIIAFALSLAEIFHFTWLALRTPPDSEDHGFLFFFTIGMIMLFVIIGVLCVLPQIREHFSIKSKALRMGFILAGLLLIDRFIW